MLLFSRKNENKDQFSEKLKENGIKHEYNESTKCYIYMDLVENCPIRIHKVEEGYELDGKVFSEEDIISILIKKNKEGNGINRFKEDERYNYFFEAIEFMTPFFDKINKNGTIETKKDEISYINSEEILLSEKIEDDETQFGILNGSSYSDIETAIIRLFESLYDLFKGTKDELLSIFPQKSRFYYNIERYLLSRTLVDKINNLMDTEAQIVDEKGTLFIILKNGSGIEFFPPCTRTKTQGYIRIDNYNEMRRAEDNKDFNLVMKILNLTELIVPAI